MRVERRPSSFLAAAVGSLPAFMCLLFGCGQKATPGHVKKPAAAEVKRVLPLGEAKRRAAESPNNPEALVDLARALRGTNAAAAAKSLRDALRLDPENASAYQTLASLYNERRYLDRLLDLCEERLRSAPNDVDALLRSGRIYRQLYRTDVAQQRVSAASRAAPGNPLVAVEQFDTYYRKGKYEEALASAQAALSRDPRDHAAHFRASEPLRILKRFEEAEASIREAIRLKPNHGPYHRQLSHVLAIAKLPVKQPEAESAARAAIQLGDDNIDTRYWLALSIDQQGRTADAISAYEAVAKLDISYERAAYRLGVLYRQVGRAEESKKMLALFDEMDRNLQIVAKAVKDYRTKPLVPEHALRFAAVLRNRSETDLAVVVLRRALRNGNDDRIRRHLAEALDAEGRHIEARAVRGGGS